MSRAFNYEGEIKWDKNKADGTPKKQLNISRMKNLGWEAKINIDDGIKSSIEAYKKSLI